MINQPIEMKPVEKKEESVKQKSQLRRVMSLLRRFWLIPALFLIVSLGIAIRILTPTTPPETKPLLTLDEIIPGKTSIEKLTEILGQPIKTETTKEGLTYFYKSKQDYTEDEVIIDDNTVALYRKRFNPVRQYTISELTTQLGENPITLYGENSIAGYNLYVFSKNGVAALTSPTDRLTLEVWTFESTDGEKFLSKWGQNYQTTFKSEPVNILENIPTLSPTTKPGQP